MFTKHAGKASLLAIALGLAFFAAQAFGQDQSSQKPEQSTSQQTPSTAEQKGGAQPDAHAITSAMKSDPGLAKVNVQANAKQITLTGTVANKDERDKAEQIAQQNAQGRKVTNKIRINPNVHPGPGL